MKTGKLIRELRIKKGITQEELAAKTDISVRTIQRIENGEVDPRAYTLQSIASVLEVDFNTLADAEGDADPAQQSEARKWLPILHLSGLMLLILPPILLWIWKRDEVPGIRRHAVDVVNFQLSITLYLIPCAFLFLFPVLIVLGVYSQVMIILNCIRVVNDQPYRYPLSIRFIKQEEG